MNELINDFPSAFMLKIRKFTYLQKSPLNMLILITISIFLLSTALGGIYSYFVLNSESLKKHKIQPFRRQNGIFKEHFPLILLNVCLLATTTGAALYFVQEVFVMKLPSLPILIGQSLFLIFLDDAYMYFFHKFLHKNSFFFKNVHKIHHRACPPFPLDFMYVHPFEWLGGMAGAGVGAIAIYFVFGEINAFPLWIFGAFRNLHEIEIHSGLKSVFAQYIPFMGLTEHHEHHHTYLEGN
jgi:sterol desaturase/sphingolipid hydroxylase (fatty acid hydroxylase superfamily)